ncbi:hypothetical protein LZ32DRAFT_604506 [Colletotrichum eremochloae]|nr:hypothetical protein LZ32DRAFT_604506 [Colletotrichum eremochloae]
MDPSKQVAALVTEVPDMIAHDVQRRAVPVDGEDDAPPPYETSSTAFASGNPGTAVRTPPSSSRPSVREAGDADGSWSSCSSFGEDETVGLLAGEGYVIMPRPRPSREHREDDEGYARTDPMSVEASGPWESMRDTPGCCFSDSGGCCFSSRGGCCFSDRGGCCFSDTNGCCFSSNGACCCSRSGGVHVSFSVPS